MDESERNYIELNELSCYERACEDGFYSPGDSPLCDDECDRSVAEVGNCRHFWDAPG